MRTEQVVRSLPQCEFQEIIQHIPYTQQDAYRLVRYLDLTFRDVVRICSKDVEERGIHLGGRFVTWPEESPENTDLKSRMLCLAAEAEKDERLFESQKSVIRAIADLKGGGSGGQARLKQSRHLKAQNITARLPNFIVLGAPRCATSWLYECLAAHPEIFVPAVKELEFFGSYRYFLGMNWYKQHFIDWNREKVGGDVSVGYFSSPEAPVRMHKDLDHTSLRLIVLLREPVNRALSYYRHRLVKGNAPSSFEQSVKIRYFRKLYIETGHYYRYYQHWLDYFPKKHILILLFEKIQKDPRVMLRKTFEFLGVDQSFDTTVFDKKSNVGRSIRSLTLHYLLHRAGAFSELVLPYGNIGKGIRRALVFLNNRLNISPRCLPLCVDERVLRNLRDEFGPSNMNLQEMAGIDLSLWEETTSYQLSH